MQLHPPSLRFYALLHALRTQSKGIYFHISAAPSDSFTLFSSVAQDDFSVLIVQNRQEWLFLVYPSGDQEHLCARQQEA